MTDVLAPITNDRSTAAPVVASSAAITVVQNGDGFDVSWDNGGDTGIECYEVSRNDGQTFRTTSTGLHDNIRLVTLSLYQYSVSIRSGKKLSIPTVSATLQYTGSMKTE
jgi:hypothetical protein